MFDRMVLGVLAALTLTTPAAAKDCPTQEFSHEAREQAVRDAPTCQASLEVMEACAYGATGDTSLGEIVIEKCEADFLTKLSKAQRKTYEAEVKRCDAKARGGREGTMYISAAAFCRAGVAQRTARRFAKSGAKTGGKPPIASDQAALGSAALAFSTIAWKAAGSMMASSDITLRSTMMPALASPSMNFE
jgi:hypothetical protein